MFGLSSTTKTMQSLLLLFSSIVLESVECYYGRLFESFDICVPTTKFQQIGLANLGPLDDDSLLVDWFLMFQQLQDRYMGTDKM